MCLSNLTIARGTKQSKDEGTRTAILRAGTELSRSWSRRWGRTARDQDIAKSTGTFSISEPSNCWKIEYLHTKIPGKYVPSLSLQRPVSDLLASCLLLSSQSEVNIERWWNFKWGKLTDVLRRGKNYPGLPQKDRKQNVEEESKNLFLCSCHLVKIQISEKISKSFLDTTMSLHVHSVPYIKTNKRLLS